MACLIPSLNPNPRRPSCCAAGCPGRVPTTAAPLAGADMLFMIKCYAGSGSKETASLASKDSDTGISIKCPDSII